MKFYLNATCCCLLAGLSILLFSIGAGILCHGVQLAFGIGWNAVTLAAHP